MTDPVDALVEALRTIRTSWPNMLALTAAPATGGGDPAKPPVSAHVLSVRRETAECLASWARLVAEERDLRPVTGCPSPRRVRVFGPMPRNGWPVICGCQHGDGLRTVRDAHPLDADDAHAVAGFLITHAEWLAEHEAGSAAVDEVKTWAQRCLDIVERNRVRRYRIGPCPEQTEDEDGSPLGPCPGTLYALLREDDKVLPRAVVCDGPQLHTWDPWQWRALGKRLGTSVMAS